MATSEFKPPTPLTFSGNQNLAEEFKRWEQKFNNFMVASGKSEKDKKVQVAVFLTCIGDDGLDIFNNFTWADNAHKEDPDQVIKKFRDYCEPRKNSLIERYKFWTISQRDGSIDEFMTDLRTKAKNCEFGDQKDAMIRDRIIFGINDERLRERLLRDAEVPTLQKTIDMCRAAEASKKQLTEMKNEMRGDQKVAFVKKSDSHKGTQQNRKAIPSKKKLVVQPPCDRSWRTAPAKDVNCTRCGTTHKARSCPAYMKKCKLCHKLNHFARCCQYAKKRVYENEMVGPDDEVFSGELRISSIEKGWFSNVKVGNTSVKFKLDTGAEASVVPMHTFKQMKGAVLDKTKVKLKTFSNSTIKPVGTTTVKCETRPKCSKQLTFYVVDFNCTPVLGVDACEQLNLIARVDSIEKKYVLETVLNEYADVFQGLGKFDGKYHIEIDKNVSPVVNAPRNVPYTVMPKLKETLEGLVEKGVILPVNEATDWVNSLVIVQKSDKSLRLCLDPRDLNKAIKRHHYKMPTLHDVTSQLSGKTVFTILDEKDGYHQVELDDESSFLCTFQTPFGRYRYLRLPFGIKSASEIFAMKNSQTFGDIEGVHMIADDMIIAGKDDREHDEILEKVLKRAEEKNVRFNKNKLQFKVKSVKYMGSIVSANGIEPDPEKIKAIVEMPAPEDKKGVQRLLGTVNFLASYIPNMSEITAPLRNLLQKDAKFEWAWEQENSMKEIRKILTSNPVLKFYDVNKEITIQTDASQSGIGCCLLQDGHVIAYSSRSLTDAEKRYAQIEKELLSIVHACDKFSQYIWNKETKVVTDHRPIESLMKKPLNRCPPRLQRMLLQLQKYTLTVNWSPGKYMYVADTLSRAYLEETDSTDLNGIEMDIMIQTLVTSLPFSETQMTEIRSATEKDNDLVQLTKSVVEGWPNHRKSLPENVRPYWEFQTDIHVIDGILFMGERVIIPSEMRKEILLLLHEGHMGMAKTKARANQSMYWPRMKYDIEKICTRCATCNKYKRKKQKEPLKQHELPERPWQKLGIDIFEYKKRDYVLVVDYYSKFVEIRLLNGKSAKSVESALLAILAVHGIPEEIIGDNMPFNSTEFRNFAHKHKFKMTTTSPTFSSSNGMAERHIGITKKLLKKAHEEGKNESTALLEHRNTPITGCDYSPAQLLFNRRLRDKLPTKSSLLILEIPANAREQLLNCQEKQKFYHDRNAKSLKPLKFGDSVRYWKNDIWEPAVVKNKHSSPRSYIITNEDGTLLRRNRYHLQKTDEPTPEIIPDDLEYENLSTEDTVPSHPPVGNQGTQRELRPRETLRKPERFRDTNFV